MGYKRKAGISGNGDYKTQGPVRDIARALGAIGGGIGGFYTLGPAGILPGVSAGTAVGNDLGGGLGNLIGKALTNRKDLVIIIQHLVLQ